jgi:hypothetical protein
MKRARMRRSSGELGWMRVSISENAVAINEGERGGVAMAGDDCLCEGTGRPRNNKIPKRQEFEISRRSNLGRQRGRVMD